MEEGTPSITAIGSAMLRAAHLLWDDAPKIFEDTFALRLSGCDSETALREQFDRLDAELARSVGPGFTTLLRRYSTAGVAVRSRYIEDEVDQALGRGVSQYVILGAGLDSFAYRRLDLAKILRVFEVDHPATQAWKRTRLQDAGIELPPNLSLVFGDRISAQGQLHVDQAQFAGLLDAVRNTILEWSLELEKSGIVGDGLSFSRPERERAHEPNVIVNIDRVDNFSGVAGVMSGPVSIHAQQTSHAAKSLDTDAVRDFRSQLRQSLPGLELSPNDKRTVAAHIRVADGELGATMPNQPKLRSALESVRRIVESTAGGAGGTLLAHGVLSLLGHLLG